MSKVLKITWLAACENCGFSDYAEVTTDRGIGCYLWDGDQAKCPKCGATGIIECEDGAANVNWNMEQANE
ncbi:hypothetical protein P255_02952 [Acinetobacter brisouii CIP 110357]|uniref:Uncharacterized protein n=1 Tax=Acinetobacter brisouii CIP 110357 TaxID=1341683 RepID=V2UFK5_9GAMM|nr:hypothetical protein [Acinetobacter brisouii]ENV46215.1 hypothetical protein F954_02850 [Acinetobacter brisouii ANC 4119]ESK47470.1 hypothetical protein P255_02952 [Acinetobacter brisouii CIP 110357]